MKAAVVTDFHAPCRSVTCPSPNQGRVRHLRRNMPSPQPLPRIGKS